MKKLILLMGCLLLALSYSNAQSYLYIPEGRYGLRDSYTGRVGVGLPDPEAFLEVRAKSTISWGFDPRSSLFKLSDGNNSMIFDHEKILGQRRMMLGFDPAYQFTINALEQTANGPVYVPLLTIDGAGNLEAKRKNGQYANLYRFGGLYLTWDGDTYGTNTHHSIRSTYGDTYGDDITINSFDNIRLNLDANNNNPTSAFEIGQHNTHISNVLFKVESPTGNVGIGTTAPQAKLHVGGDIYGETGLRFTNNSSVSKGIVWGSTSWTNYYSRIDNFDGQLRVMTDDYFYLTDLDQSTGLPGNVTLYANTNSGTVGIGTVSPDSRGKLEVKGHFTLDGGNLYTGTGTEELSRYLHLVNSLGRSSASGLKAGGVLVSDSYSYADPGKNDLVVKGAVAIGTASTTSKLHIENSAGNVDAKVVAADSFKSSLKLFESQDYGFELEYDGASDKLQLWSRKFNLNEAVRMTWLKDGNVGIGTIDPKSALDVVGNIQISNASIPMGLMTEVGGTTPLLNMSINYREPNKDTNYIGASFRIDSRSTQPLYQWKLRPAGATTTGEELDLMVLTKEGSLGIGTTSPGAYKLAVNGDIKAKKVNVTLEGWSDFVFEENYVLRPLAEVEEFIKEKKHLPDVPSEAEVKANGVDVGKMDATLLQKIEELTLYMIELKKENDRLKEKVAQIEGLLSK